MQADSEELRSEDLRRNLAIADRLREIVSSVKGDVDFKDSLSEIVPQIVVIGMQSRGKSSVLERLSKIKFPRGSDLCTRVQIELKMKRGEEMETKVYLRSPGDERDNFDSGDITQDIKDAQDEAVKRCGVLIARDYAVEIECQSPDRVNVTLVDLPGVFAPDNKSDKEIAESVKQLAEKFAHMKSSLVLHVMGVNDDYGNVATKLMISELDQAKVISVFTMVDLLCDKKIDPKERRKILKKYLDDINGPKFAVYGMCTGGDQDEIDFLQQLNLFRDEDEVGLGARALGKNLEDRISAFMSAVLPQTKSEVAKNLETTLKLVEEHKEQSPHEVVQRLVTKMQKCWQMESYEHSLRLLFEKMRQTIRRLRVRSLKGHDNLKLREILMDDMEIGDEVFVEVEYEDEDGEVECNFDPMTIKSFDGQGNITLVGKDNTECRKDSTDVYVPDLVESLLEEVLEVVENRGLSNITFFDRRIVLESYMGKFADEYGAALGEVVDDAHRIACKSIASAFDKLMVSPSAAALKQTLHAEMESALKRLLDEANKFVGRMVLWCKPPLYTTNEHYLLQNIRNIPDQASAQQMAHGIKAGIALNEAQAQAIRTLLAAKRPPTDADVKREAALDIIKPIEAFWKVKVKLVTEAAASELTLIFLTEARAALREIGDKAQQHADSVKDTQAMVSIRRKYTERARALQEALDLFA